MRQYPGGDRDLRRLGIAFNNSRDGEGRLGGLDQAQAAGIRELTKKCIERFAATSPIDPSGVPIPDDGNHGLAPAHKALAKIILDARVTVENGEPLSVALDKSKTYPVFSTTCIPPREDRKVMKCCRRYPSSTTMRSKPTLRPDFADRPC
jgi:hypothetical protein